MSFIYASPKETTIDPEEDAKQIEYIDENYNPEKLTTELKNQAASNPVANEEVNEANHSATPEPVTKKTETETAEKAVKEPAETKE